MVSRSNDGVDYFAYSDTKYDYFLLQMQTAVHGSSILRSARYEKLLKQKNLQYLPSNPLSSIEVRQRACLDVIWLV